MDVLDIRDPKLENFAELVGNGKRFSVPLYQRDYSWGEELWEDLWQDLHRLAALPRGRHFMGVVVLEERNDRDFVIVDGQQRLVTLSILCIAAIRRLLEMSAETGDAGDRERAESLRRSFVSSKDAVALHERAKLTLNQMDGNFFLEHIVHERDPVGPERTRPKSNRLLWACLKWFGAKFADREWFPNGPSVASMVEEVVGRRTRFIRLTVASESEAYTLFETMNARMLELSGTDLIRNLLFSRVPSEGDKQSLAAGWGRIATTVGQEHVPDLMRYHLSCTHAKVRERRILQLVSPSLETPRAVFDLMHDLERRGTLLAALGDEHDDFWSGMDEDTREVRSLVRVYRILRVSQATPLLFAAYERFDRRDFIRTLRLVVFLSFRATIVSRLSPGAFESLYHHAARAVIDQSARKPRDVWAALRGVHVSDDKFREDFAALEVEGRGPRKAVLRYILAELERSASGRATDAETDPFTVEHIWPEAKGWEWSVGETSHRFDPPVWRIGNLTVVEREINRAAGARAFGEKLVEYRRSTYSLTQKLALSAPEEWTLAAIEARQRLLAEAAVRIWRIDFDD